MNSAIGRQNALAWSIDPIAGISAASRPIAPFPGLPQDRPNLSNCEHVICNR
jgi:hypothetical protein